MKTKEKFNQGITLVALVITIIILLILLGISISALTQTGLFSKAKNAEQLSKEKQEEENTTLGTYENEIDKYIGENSGNNSNTPKEIKLVDKVNDGTIKIGDYVKYKPDVTSTETILQELGTYSGNTDNTKNTTSTLTQEMNLNWRVLDVKDGQVRLISDGPTTSTIALSGYNGYNNAVKLLDDACSTLYSNETLASKVQNLKIEDIQDKMVEKDFSKITSEYGKIYTSSTKYYPNIVLNEKNQTTNGELNLSEQKDLINQTTEQTMNTLKIKYTYWNKLMVVSDFYDNQSNNYYELFINNGDNYPEYWLSSRCILADSNHANFNIRAVISGYVFAYYSYSSDSRKNDASFAFRPVVTLNANVQIDTENSGNGSIAEQDCINLSV